MPRRKRGGRSLALGLLVVVLVAPLSFGLVSWLIGGARPVSVVGWGPPFLRADLQWLEGHPAAEAPVRPLRVQAEPDPLLVSSQRVMDPFRPPVAQRSEPISAAAPKPKAGPGPRNLRPPVAPPLASAPPLAPPPPARSPAATEALALLEALQALSRAPAEELAAGAEALRALPAQDARVEVARERCALAFVELARGLELHQKAEGALEAMNVARPSPSAAERIAAQLREAERQAAQAERSKTACAQGARTMARALLQ